MNAKYEIVEIATGKIVARLGQGYSYAEALRYLAAKGPGYAFRNNSTGFGLY